MLTKPFTFLSMPLRPQKNENGHTFASSHKHNIFFKGKVPFLGVFFWQLFFALYGDIQKKVTIQVVLARKAKPGARRIPIHRESRTRGGSGMQCAALHESGRPGAVVAFAEQR